ncbi:MAG: glycerol-3-phosphate 1-O-acyltransferase PlsY [Gemmatimonadota bacterium]
MTVVALLLAAYALGSIPTSYLVGRSRGVDLREHGSGNLGGTNVYRVLGPGAAAPVLLIDVAKGWAPVALFPAWDGSGQPTLALAYGLAAIAGHVWSLFLRFQGGKGVATGAGVLVALAPLTTLVAFLVWAGVVLITRIVSVASLAAVSVVPPVAYLTDAPRPTILFTVGVALFVWWTHRENLARLMRGQELRFRRRGSAGEEGAP